MFYKSVGMHSKSRDFDPIASRIGHRITSSFSATNTVEVCDGEWNLASFVPDAGHTIYRELLIQRNCYLIKEAICGILASGIFMIIELPVFIFGLGKNAGYAVMGGTLSLCGIVYMITWLDAYVKLTCSNRMIQNEKCDAAGDQPQGASPRKKKATNKDAYALQFRWGKFKIKKL